jgi:hypothetical protein
VGAGISLTIALHPRLIVADNHDDHSCGAAPAEQVSNEGVGGLELRERCGLGLRPMHQEGQEEDEGCQQAGVFIYLDHFRWSDSNGFRLFKLEREVH